MSTKKAADTDRLTKNTVTPTVKDLLADPNAIYALRRAERLAAEWLAENGNLEDSKRDQLTASVHRNCVALVNPLLRSINPTNVKVESKSEATILVQQRHEVTWTARKLNNLLASVGGNWDAVKAVAHLTDEEIDKILDAEQ